MTSRASDLSALGIDPDEYLREQLMIDGDDWEQVMFHAENSVIHALEEIKQSWQMEYDAGNVSLVALNRQLRIINGKINQLKKERL